MHLVEMPWGTYKDCIQRSVQKFFSLYCVSCLHSSSHEISFFENFSQIQVTPFNEKGCHIESSGTLSTAVLSLHLKSSPHTTDTVLYNWNIHISPRGSPPHGRVRVLTGDTVTIINIFNHVQKGKSFVFLASAFFSSFSGRSL